MTKLRIFLAASVGVVIALSVSPLVRADTYTRDSYVFDVPGLTLNRVQDMVLSILSVPQIGYASPPGPPHPILARWMNQPCFKASGGDAATRGMVTKAAEYVSRKAGLLLRACSTTEAPKITYYLDGENLSDAEKVEIRNFIRIETDTEKLFDNLEHHNLACFWRFHSPEPTAVSIAGAIIVVAPPRLVSGNVDRCLILGTLGALGLNSPTGTRAVVEAIDPESWKQSVELDFLALFVLYHVPIVTEDNDRRIELIKRFIKALSERE